MRFSRPPSMPAALPGPVLGQSGKFPLFLCGDTTRSETGTVTYINADHLWYQVTFKNGIRQGFRFGDEN